MYEFSEKDGKISELKRAQTLKEVKAREKEQSFGLVFYLTSRSTIFQSFWEVATASWIFVPVLLEP